MNIVRRFLLSLFIIKVLFYDISNRERESCVGIMREHNIQTLYREMFFFVYKSCKTFSAIIFT